MKSWRLRSDAGIRVARIHFAEGNEGESQSLLGASDADERHPTPVEHEDRRLQSRDAHRRDKGQAATAAA